MTFPEWISSKVASKGGKQVKRIAVGIIGGTVLLIGCVLIFIPGPAFIVIPAGLAILATEFAWARRWLKRAREIVAERTGRGKKKQPEESDAPYKAEEPARH